jgi:flavin reductase (DIM6/NTAB) family NADH-FMN oxidoreductase RutF
MKRSIDGLTLIHPVPIVLVGAWFDGRASFATVGDCAIMGLKPALLAISLGEGGNTVGGVIEDGSFSINLPPTALLAEVDACGIASGREIDKSSLFTVSHGERTGAPCVEECPVNLECRVVERVHLDHRRIFIAEVLVAHVDESLLADGDPPRLAALTALDPILYGLDNRYYRIGKPIGMGYAEGQDIVEAHRTA